MSAEIILHNLDAGETQRVIGLAASKAVENGNLAALLRSPYGHYSSILVVAADHIEDLYSKIKTLEASANRPEASAAQS